MKLFIPVLSSFCFLSLTLSYAAETVRISTPRGTSLDVTVHTVGNAGNRSAAKSTIIIAPGQSCNSKGPLFETLGKNGESVDFTVVRFEWAYCLNEPDKRIPSDDLSTEVEDFVAVLQYASTVPAVDMKRVVLSGKSLGSLVAYTIFKRDPSVKALALLTPLCSQSFDDAGNPLPKPLNVGEENYPGLKGDARPIFLSLGNRDPSCTIPVLYDYLKDARGNVDVSVSGGDHGLRIKDAAGILDEARTSRNIQSAIFGVLNWAELSLR